jgi:hypothetical protein
VTRLAALAAIGLALASAGRAEEEGAPPAEAGRGFPFAAEADPDGSRFVWFLLDRAGIPHEYLPASEFLASPRWEPAPRHRRRPGDLAWWKGFVALYRGERPGGEVGTAAGRRRLEDLETERGPARFVRLLPLPPLRPAPRSLVISGRTVRWANPDPGAWTEGEPGRGDSPAAALVSLRRRPVREPGGGEALPVILLGATEGGRDAPPPIPLRLPPDARVLEVEATPGGTRRLVAHGGKFPAFRTLSLSRAAEGLLLVAACTATETTWRVVERECQAFLASLAVEPAR